VASPFGVTEALCVSPVFDVNKEFIYLVHVKNLITMLKCNDINVSKNNNIHKMY